MIPCVNKQFTLDNLNVLYICVIQITPRGATMKVKATIKSIKTDEDGETQLQLLIPYQYLLECTELAQMIKKVLNVTINEE